MQQLFPQPLLQQLHQLHQLHQLLNVEEDEMNNLRLTVDVAATPQGIAAATITTTTSTGQIDNVNEISEIPVRGNHVLGHKKLNSNP